MKYIFSAEVTVSLYTVVEADSQEEAKKTAEERTIEASRWGDKRQPETVWVNDEYDGDVSKISCETN